MPVKPSLVVNSSPLIALVAALPDFDVLSSIVERFIVPSEVMAEIDAGGLKDSTAERVRAARWCEVRPARALTSQQVVSSLGSGEASVIQTALDESLPTVVIDEVKGRRAARMAGLRVIGSLGILVELHCAGLLSSVADAIRAMQAKGIYLAPHLIELTIETARRPHP